MLNIKSDLKILGHDYNVEFSKEAMLGNGTSGMCSTNLLKIVLDPSVPISRRDEAFLHEIIEALKYHLELKIEHSDLSALSEGLYQVLTDNDMLRIIE